MLETSGRKSLDPYRRANDMWHVKHLNGLMLVSIKISRPQERGRKEQGTLTSEDVSFEVLIAGELSATVGTEDGHLDAR